MGQDEKIVLNDNCPKVAVIIPFFQREQGILRKAVASVLRQNDYNNYSIIIVDDGSPVHAENELRDTSPEDARRISIIRQDNAGPGAARNRAMDAIPGNTRYVAFLDSDDEWSAHHLRNAVLALEQGYDLYFAAYRYENREPVFGLYESSKSHLLIDKNTLTFEYSGDLFNDLTRGNFIGTSTVVYRYYKWPRLRFRADLFNGQDYFFWLEFLQLSRKVVFSAAIDCIYGHGINIWVSNFGWDSAKRLALLSNMIKVEKRILGQFGLSRDQRSAVIDKISLYRYDFGATLLHDIRLGRLDIRVAVRHLLVDPMTYVRLLPNMPKIVSDKHMKKA